MKQELLKMQKEVDAMYERDGITDEILDKQLEINKLRHEHNIADRNEYVYEEFVQ